MSSTALTWVRTQLPRTDAGKPDSDAKHILRVLCEVHNDQDPTFRLFVGQEYIAAQTGLGLSTVSKRLKTLESCGYIRRERQVHAGGPRKGQRKTDHYFIELTRQAEDLESNREQPEALRRAQTGHSPETSGQSDRARWDGAAFLPEHMASDVGAGPERLSRPVETWTTTDVAGHVHDLLGSSGWPAGLSCRDWAKGLADLRGRYRADPQLEMFTIKLCRLFPRQMGVVDDTSCGAAGQFLSAIMQMYLDERFSEELVEREVSPPNRGRTSWNWGEGPFPTLEACWKHQAHVEQQRIRRIVTSADLIEHVL